LAEEFVMTSESQGPETPNDDTASTELPAAATASGDAPTSVPATASGDAPTSVPATASDDAPTSVPATAFGDAPTSVPATASGHAPSSVAATPAAEAAAPAVTTPDPHPETAVAEATTEAPKSEASASEDSSTAAPPADGAAGDPAPEASPAGDAASDATETSNGDPQMAEGANGSSDPGTGAPGEKKKRKRKKRKKPKSASAARPASERAPFHVGEEVFGKVTAVLEHAIMVDLGGKALAVFDRSEMEADDLVPEVSDRMVARVHNDGARGGLVVLTRKPLREEEIKPKVEQCAADGSPIEGLITGVIKGGVEVDILGLRAFAPASGMDLHPNQANFASLLGQRMEFKVVQYKSQGRDVVVTRRPMLEAEAHERRKHALTLLSEGQTMKGLVRTVVEWGAFVALPEAENLEGLVHITEASHDARAKITDLMKPGDEVEVQITKIDEKGKIWLSRKALIEDPWAEAKAKYSSGSKHTGKVARLEDFGAFISLEQSIDGLIHVADLAFERIEHPSKVLTVGQEVDVVVHNFDNKYKRIALHLAPTGDRANEEHQKVSRGASIQVEVVKAESAGLVVRVLGATGRAARGFVPAGQTGTQRGTDLRKHFKAGSVLKVKVLDVDPRRGEPKLSVRALAEDEERSAHREYRKALQKEGGFGTLGDLLKQRLSGGGD
jgi:small subunit ribosomal protein S1